MEGLCINGTFKVELERDDGVRLVYAVRYDEEEASDLYFLNYRDACIYRKKNVCDNCCPSVRVIRLETKVDDAIYISAKYNSSQVKNKRNGYSFIGIEF